MGLEYACEHMKKVKFEPELEELLVKAQKAFKKYKGMSSVELLKKIRGEPKVRPDA